MTSLSFWIEPLWLAWVDLIAVVVFAAFAWACRDWKRNLHEVPLLHLLNDGPAWIPTRQTSFAHVFAQTAASAVAWIPGFTASKPWAG